MPAISIEDLRVSFGALDILRDLSLAVEEGEFLVLLGSSGCGKSTLLNTIAGLIEPKDGRIVIDGEDVTDREPNERGIAMVFQSYALYPKMSVRGNLAFSLRVAGLPRAEIRARVEEVARFLQITELLGRRPAQLSGGQRQRVAIGRALVRRAKVFLFDEPLSNLDAKLRADLRVEIKRLHRDLGNTMIYVTHDQVEALTLADRIAVMKDGIIQQLASPDDIYDRPANLYVASFIGSPTINLLDGVVSHADGAPTLTWGELAIPLDGAPAREIADGRRVVLGVRPEHLSPVPDSAAAPLKVRVDLVENMGSETIVWGLAGDKMLSIRLPGKPHFAEGEELALAIDLTNVCLFDTETGARL